MIVAAVMTARLLRPSTTVLAYAALTVLMMAATWGRTWTHTEDILMSMRMVAPIFFTGGVVYFWWHRTQSLPMWPLLPCAAFLPIGIATHTMIQTFPLYGVYPILYLATTRRLQLPSMRKFGDISYGIYLFGWPVEQMVRSVLHDPGWLWVFLVSMALLVPIGYVSWHLVERRALRLKNATFREVAGKFTNWRRRSATAS